MRKMRRGLSLVMASVMAASLAGCSGGGKTETSAAATETKAAETTAEAGTTQGAEDNQEEITLRFVSWQTIMTQEIRRLLRLIRSCIQT